MDTIINRSLTQSQVPISRKKKGDDARKFLVNYINTALCTQGDSYYNAEKDTVDKEKYYQDIESSEVEYNQLHRLLSSTYHKAERRINLWADIDRQPDGTLKCAYSDKLIETADFIRQCKADEEHLVPQSWHHGSGSHPGQDMHQIFIVSKTSNGSRGNRIFGTADGELVSKEGGMRYGSNYFVPHHNIGAVCRATLYTLVMYDHTFHKSYFPPAALKWIIEKANTEPISLWERHRNQELFKLQGNRNPFIDHPEWCDQINYLAGYMD